MTQVGATTGRLYLLGSITIFVLIAGCLGTGLPAAGSPTQPTPTPLADQPVVTVTEVVDGDTIEVRFQGGTTDTVRLLGIDTPEVHTETDPSEFEGVPDSEDGRACLREAGRAATEYLATRLAQKRVRLVFDPQADRRGSYDRLLAYVYFEGTNVNYALVDEGYARVYDSRFSKSDRFYGAEATARDAGRGLWRCSTGGTAPSGQTGLVVATIHADARGDDNENLNDEYIVIANTGDDPIDLSGWYVEDTAGHSYRFPDGFTLGPGATVRFHTGDGTDTTKDLYWGADGAIWNNGGDKIVVKAGNGTVMLDRSY